MIRHWLATPATLARHWKKLAGESRLVVLGAESPHDLGLDFSGDGPGRGRSYKFSSLCLQLLADAGVATGRLLEQAQIDEVIRAALRDERCAAIAEFQGVQRRPGQVRRLSDRLKRTSALEYADAEALPWFADPALETLRGVYREKLAAAGGIDMPGLFLRFLAESQAGPLQAAIGQWHESLVARNGPDVALVIPDADRLLEETLKFERAIALLLFDRFPEVHLGSHVWPDDSPVRVQSILEGWMAVGAEPWVIDPDTEPPEFWFVGPKSSGERAGLVPAGRLRFVQARDAKDEITQVVGHVRELVDAGISPGAIEVRTPLAGDFVGHLREGLEAAGLEVEQPPTRLIDAPRVRAMLDLAEAIAADWPAEALADLLRHPDFHRPSFAEEVTEFEVARLALEIERLGNVNGLELIRRMMLVNMDERSARRVRGSDEIVQGLVAVEALENLQSALPVPAFSAIWADRVAELKAFGGAMFDARFMGDEAIRELFAALENGIGAAIADDMTPWTWAEFLREAQLRAESATMAVERQSGGETKRWIRLRTGESARLGLVDHLVLAGMTEGHYPSRSAIRDALLRKDQVDLEVLRAEQLRRFRETVGAAAESLWISHHRRDEQGVATEPAGFLRDETWETIGRPAGESESPAAEVPPEILRTIEAAVARARERGGAYDGELADPLVLSDLANRFGAGYTFSASSLEAASLCSFKFFGNYVLGLGEGEVDDDLATDYRAEGETIHAVLEDLHRSMPMADLARLGDEALHDRLVALVGERHPCPPRLASSDLGRARWEVQNLRIVTKLAAYGRQLRKDLDPPSRKNVTNAATLFDGDFEVLECELRAGAGSARLRRLSIGAGGDGPEILIGGRIDRIDGTGTGEQRRVRLIDYKTGVPITKEEIKARRHLQLPIYAMMVHGNRFSDAVYEVDDIGFWYSRPSKGGYVSIREWVSGGGPFDVDLLRIEYEPWLRSLVGGIRAGRFRVQPKVFGCEDRCDLAELCRIRERRAHWRTSAAASVAGAAKIDP